MTIDKDVQAAREIIAKNHEAMGNRDVAEAYRAGSFAGDRVECMVVAGIVYGRETR